MTINILKTGWPYMLVISALALVGCGGGSGDSTTPTPTTNSTPNSTPATTPSPAPAASPAATTAPPPSGVAKWTYMIYIAGDNNLDQAAIKDINEMEQVGSSTDVNVIVISELRPQNYPQGQTPQTFSGKVEKDADTSTINSPLTSLGDNLDMGSPDTLRRFIIETARDYPAEKYALVLWSHGAGWKSDPKTGGAIRGALQDETAGTFMSLAGIAQAIADSEINLELIDFDACLMAMYEVALALKDYTSVFVASEEVEPGDGNPYATLLGDLVANPDMDGKGLAQATVQRFTESYSSGRESTTKSALDMSQFSVFDGALRDLSAYLVSNISSLRPQLQSARDKAVGYLYPENRDIGDVLDQLLTSGDSTLVSKAQAVKSALNNLVIANDTNTGEKPEINRSQGLAIFLPSRNQVSQDDLDNYAALASSQLSDSWNQLVTLLITGEAGEQSLQETTAGNFSVCARWSDPNVDLDLYVYEPRPLELYAPWVGATSPNGFFTGDSVATGFAEECFAAADQIEVGRYDFFVNYFDGPGPEQVEFFLSDASTNFEYVKVDGRQIGFEDASPPGTNPIDNYDTLLNNPYSDWFYAGVYNAGTVPSRSFDASTSRTTERDRVIAQRVFSKRRALSKRRQAQRAQ